MYTFHILIRSCFHGSSEVSEWFAWHLTTKTGNLRHWWGCDKWIDKKTKYDGLNSTVVSFSVGNSHGPFYKEHTGNYNQHTIDKFHQLLFTNILDSSYTDLINIFLLSSSLQFNLRVVMTQTFCHWWPWNLQVVLMTTSCAIGDKKLASWQLSGFSDTFC